ncbi:MAG: hypothetical protein M3463_22795, partial [Verrucomicrobiota bacterium]|nr:hypothetical protein [Verrucomicrobiota bacterium]
HGSKRRAADGALPTRLDGDWNGRPRACFRFGERIARWLAVSIGGVLLAYRALQKFTQGLSHLIGAAIAWKQIAPLFKAAGRPEQRGVPVPVDAKAGTLLDAHDVAFRHHGRDQAVLRLQSPHLQR